VPRLSVLMPVYNGARYLGESIASVLGQDFRDLELVVIDDGSTDDTPRVVAEWAARDSRVVVLRRNENGGTARALNAALPVARGEYFARQDSDDIAAPFRFSRQVASFDASPDVVVVSMAYRHIDAQGRLQDRIDPYEEPEVLHHLLHFAPALGAGGQLMFRAAAVRQLGGWEGAFRVSQGWEISTRLCRLGRVVVLHDVGIHYRRHPGGVSVVHGTEQMANAVTIARRGLTHLLGRAATQEEAEAVGSIWFAAPSATAAPLADAVLRETFGRFSAAPRQRSRVRLLHASRFARAAMRLMRKGEARGAFRHLLLSLRWHMLGAVAAVRSAIQARLSRGLPD